MAGIKKANEQYSHAKISGLSAFSSTSYRCETRNSIVWTALIIISNKDNFLQNVLFNMFCGSLLFI